MNDSAGYEYQYKNFAEALYDALTEDAFYCTMEKSVSPPFCPKEAMLRYLDFSMLEAAKYGELNIPIEHQYGVSIWSKPQIDLIEKQKSSDKVSFILENMGENSLKIYQQIVDFMSSKSEPVIDNNAWYLSIVGILPAFQNKGYGPGLITNILAKTDQLKRSTYLETFTPRNMSFYQRLGYQVVDCFIEPTANSKYWLMLRGPQDNG